MSIKYKEGAQIESIDFTRKPFIDDPALEHFIDVEINAYGHLVLRTAEAVDSLYTTVELDALEEIGQFFIQYAAWRRKIREERDNG